MNIERLKIYIDNWYEYIDKSQISLLEKDIDIELKDLIIDLLVNIYNEYSPIIKYIPYRVDTNEQYIIKPIDGKYSLEDFLINRLLRNISIIDFKEQYVMPESHYDYVFGEVLLDMDRMEKELGGSTKRRKVVVNEILHGLKTQFVDKNVFRMDDYYNLKEKLKTIFPDEINDFEKYNGIDQNGLCSHVGLEQKKSYVILLDDDTPYYETEILDEIFNELDSMKYVSDSKKQVRQFTNGLYIGIKNPESSNAFITNYAYIIERLLQKGVLFVGMYLNPSIMFREINKKCDKVFKREYDSDESAVEIICEQLSYIKKKPNDTDSYIRLLNSLYYCFKVDEMDDASKKDILKCLALNGLLEQIDGKLIPYDALAYYNAYKVKNSVEIEEKDISK